MNDIETCDMLKYPNEWRVSMHQKDLCYICTQAQLVVLFYIRPKMYEDHKDDFYTTLVGGVNCDKKVIESLREFAP